MDRLARLYALAEALRLAGDDGRSSAWLAERFEVTPRTIRRDMATLQEAGMPIWSANGPGGGYRLLATAGSLPPIEFTDGEAAAIAIALAAQREGPLAAEARAALTKLLRSMPEERRDAAAALAGRTWTRDAAPPRNPAARTLDEAARLGRVVVIDYRDAGGALSRARPIEPLAFGLDEDTWYVFAWCQRRQAGRSFRLDRIERAFLTAEPAPARDLRAVFPDIPPDAAPVLLDG